MISPQRLKILKLKFSGSEPVPLNTSFIPSPFGVKAFGKSISFRQSSSTNKESEALQPEALLTFKTIFPDSVIKNEESVEHRLNVLELN